MNILSFFRTTATRPFVWFLRQKRFIQLAIAVVVIGIGVLAVFFKPNSTSSQPQYQTAQATKGTLVVSVSGSGQVSTANSASVTTKATGVVKKIYVKNGQTVKAGEKIMELDLDLSSKQSYEQALASYQSAKNAVESAKTNMYSLQSKLFAANQKFIDGAVASGIPTSDTVYIQQQADWLASEATYKNQQAVIAQAQTALNSSALSLREQSPTVYAPISGTVSGLSAQIGSVLAESSDSSGNATSQQVALIQTNAQPTVSVDLTEIDAPKIAIGDRATVTIDALSDKTFSGEVVSIDTSGAVSSGVTTYPATILLDAGVDGIYPNMSAQANIITDTKTDVILVPTAAVSTTNGESSVRVQQTDGTITIKTVEVGLSSDSQIEIVSGLNEGDVVITGTINSSTKSSSTKTQSAFSMFGTTRTGGASAGAAMGGGPR